MKNRRHGGKDLPFHWEGAAAQPTGPIVLSAIVAPPPARTGGVLSAIATAYRAARNTRAARLRRELFADGVAARNGSMLHELCNVQAWLQSHWHRAFPVDAIDARPGALSAAFRMGDFPLLVDTVPGLPSDPRTGWSRVCLGAWVSDAPSWTPPAKELFRRISAEGYVVSLHDGGLVAEACPDLMSRLERDPALIEVGFAVARYLAALAVALRARPWS